MKTAVLFGMCLGTALAGICDLEVFCDFDVVLDGIHHYFDFSPLCQTSGGDYHFTDAGGHEYYANVCGTAGTHCLPEGWDNTYEYGVAVQVWGDAPKCDTRDEKTLNCIDQQTQDKVCCTQDCQVLGVGQPTYSLMNPKNVDGGVKATFRGAPPAADDPFWCPWNPNTGSQYERTVTYYFNCDHSVDIKLVNAVQNGTEDCDYSLNFNTKYACSATSKPTQQPLPSTSPGPILPSGGGKLSGGWVFVIIVIVAITVYIAGGFVFTYVTERVWAFPHRNFWSNFGQYVGDGGRFIASCGRGGGGGAGGPKASPYSDIGSGGPAASTAAYSGSAYNASGGDGGGSSTAYTDL